MSRYEDKNSPRGWKEKKKGSVLGTALSTFVLIVAVGVFGYSAWTLYGYYKEYKAGSDEYKDLNTAYVDEDASKDVQTVTPSGSGGGLAGNGQSSGEGTSAETGGASGSGSLSGSGLQADENGEEEFVSPKGGRPGVVLRNLRSLEDPKILESEVERAATQEAEENGKKKQLPLMKNPIDFEQLQSENEEIIGWLRIGALKDSYPVTQGKDNDYYLHRTFRGEYNFAGCIFLDSANSKFFTDQNSLVYGHNMKDGSMFGTLKDFKKQEVYDSNPYFWIFTPKLIYQYRIFSCCTVSKRGDPYRIRFTSSAFQEFLDECVERSEVDTHGVRPSSQDRIVTLSTCTGDDSTRFIVQGVLEQIYLSM